MKWSYIYLWMSFFIIISCAKDSSTVGQQILTDNSATLHIEVKHFYMDTYGLVVDTPIRNFPVYLFQNLDDATHNENLLATKLTDAQGKTSFYQLDSLQYAVRLEHTLLGIKLQSIHTPHKSIVNQVISY